MSDEVKELVQRARAAQKVIEFWSQEQVDEMVAAAGWEAYKEDHARECAQLAAEETKLGRFDHKFAKHQKKTLGTLRDLHGLQTVGVINENKEKGLIQVAKPVGVIGALTPVTNASSTITVNGLAMLKCRNAVVFAPHPSAKRTCDLTASYMRVGLKKVGAPEDLFLNLKEPSIETTQALMKEVDLVVATGGPAMVKAAYSSGTPAYGVGAGNSVTVIDETADLEDTARLIFTSTTFDNATSCSAENSAVIMSEIYTAMLEKFAKYGGYLCSAEQKAILKQCMWPDGVHLNRQIVGQHALKVAEIAGLTVPENTTFLMVEGEKVGSEDPFSGEKLSPVMTLWKVDTFEQAIKMVQDLTAYSGPGHSCGLHTTREDRIYQLGEKARVSRMMVRQAQCLANSGNYDNGMPFSLTLGCGTWGGNIANENVHWKHFINTTWISVPIPPVVPDENVIFGSHWEKYGK